MSQTPKKRCRRCGGTRLSVTVFCNRTLLRCERQECDSYRLHRNRQKEWSARLIRYGPVEDAPGGSVDEMIRYFNEPGQPGFEERVRIARELLDAGFDEIEAAEEVLWTVPEMRRVLSVRAAVQPAQVMREEAA
jgi:hypothetical protein